MMETAVLLRFIINRKRQPIFNPRVVCWLSEPHIGLMDICRSLFLGDCAGLVNFPEYHHSDPEVIP